MGNICRSPAAEAVMKKLIKEEKLSHLIEVDSAGTIDYHSGEPADSRMIKFAAERGYKIDSISRQFNSSTDFERFDYIVTMDEENYEDILSLDMERKYRHKLLKMVNFCTNCNVDEVPDPYYSKHAGFDVVLDIIEDASKGLLKKIKDDLQRENQPED